MAEDLERFDKRLDDFYKKMKGKINKFKNKIEGNELNYKVYIDNEFLKYLDFKKEPIKLLDQTSDSEIEEDIHVEDIENIYGIIDTVSTLGDVNSAREPARRKACETQRASPRLRNYFEFNKAGEDRRTEWPLVKTNLGNIDLQDDPQLEQLNTTVKSKVGIDKKEKEEQSLEEKEKISQNINSGSESFRASVPAFALSIGKREHTIASTEERVSGFKQIINVVPSEDDIKGNTKTLIHDFVIIDETVKLKGCIDAKLFENFMVFSANEKIYKFCRNTKKRSSPLELRGAGKMCKITSTFYVAVIQATGFIAVIDCGGADVPVVLYKLKIDQPYNEICHYRTTDACPGVPWPSFVFAVAYSCTSFTVRGRPYSDFVDIIELESTSGRKSPRGIRPTFPITILKERLNQDEIYGISGLDTFGEKKILISCVNGVYCMLISKSSWTLFWQITTQKPVTGVCCTQYGALFCLNIDGIGQVKHVNSEGTIIKENIITDKYKDIYDKVSFYGNEVLLRKFDTHSWTSVVISQGYDH